MKKTRRRMARGFSLLEITMVILLIGILMASAALYLGGFMSRGKQKVTEQTLQTVKAALTAYYQTNSSYPADLKSLITAKYLDDKPIVDGWNRGLIYSVPGRNNRPFELGSRGENLDDPADDLSVWDNTTQPQPN